MNFVKNFISSKKLVKYRNNNGKTDYIDIDSINKMIKDITTGELGKKVEKLPYGFDLHCVYEEKQIKLEYLKEKFNLLDDLYLIYCDGIQVYPNKMQQISKNILNCDNNWINTLYDIYNRHLKLSSEVKMKQDAIKQAKEKREKVLKIFGFSYPNGFVDEEIIVSDLELGKSYSSFHDNEIYYNYLGKITLNDGTLVCDVKNNIYIPGPWEDYVCLVVDKIEQNIISEQKRRFEQDQFKRSLRRNNQ